MALSSYFLGEKIVPCATINILYSTLFVFNLHFATEYNAGEDKSYKLPTNKTNLNKIKIAKACIRVQCISGASKCNKRRASDTHKQISQFQVVRSHCFR